MNPFSKPDEFTRRQFLSNAARTYLGVHLFPMVGVGIAEAAPASAAQVAKAKHVIYLYMSGGMSHIDTFDTKPKKKEVMSSALEAIASVLPITSFFFGLVSKVSI